MRRFLYSFVLVLTALHVRAANNVLSYIYDPGSKTAEVTFDKDSKGDRIYYSGHIVIPDVVMFSDEEYMVTGIQPKAFMDNVGVTSVIIGNNVRFIGGDAFNGCTGITSISIPASVDSIGEWAFSNTGLTEVRFEDCDNPVRLWDWGGFCVFSSSPLETVYLGRNYISGARPFRGFPTLKNVTVGDFVTSLQSEEFKGSRGIRNVQLSSGVGEIGKSAFQDCDTLFSITLPESVFTIGENAFFRCEKLSSINIPAHVSFIGGCAFQYCEALTAISIPASVDSIGEWAFSNTGLTEVRFEDCDNPVRLWDWGGFCVFSSSPLETVYLGRNYISGARPFKGIQTLKTVCLGGFVDSLPGSDFEDCSNLEQIYSYLEIPPVCGPKVFNGVVKQTCRLYVPDSGIELYKVAYAWNEFFNIESGIDTILTDRESGIANGIRFNIDGRRLDTIGHGMNIISTEDGKAVKVFER